MFGLYLFLRLFLLPSHLRSRGFGRVLNELFTRDLRISNPLTQIETSSVLGVGTC